MKYIDIHTHLNIAAFADDYDVVARRALDAGVGMINVGTQKDTAQKAIDIATEYAEGVYAAIGLHPIHTSKSFHDTQEFGEEGKEFTSRGEVFDTELYRAMARHEKVVAIGECGLDYYRISEETKDKQVVAFRDQIHLANEVQKPLMLHIRDGGNGKAYRDALEVLRADAKIIGNVHFFAGTTEIAEEFLSLGYTLSFTGVITFAKDFKELVAYVPLDMMHVETDAPYVAPVPHRGKRNEPVYVTEIVKKIAEIKGLAETQVALQLRENARRVFGV